MVYSYSMTTSRFKKIFASTAMLALAATLLSGCSVSTADSDECTSRNGEVKSERFAYSGDGSFFNSSNTGNLRYCETSDGLMDPVYNDVISESRTGFWGYTIDNNQVFEGCNEIGGVTYKTLKSRGKSNVARFACVNDGRYVQILKDTK